MLSVQSKFPSLAGMLTNLNSSAAPFFANIGAMTPLRADQNATNIDFARRLMPLNNARLQGRTPFLTLPKHFGDSHSAKELAQCGGSEHRLNICPMFEFYIAGIPVSKQYRNSDLYGDLLPNFETSTREKQDFSDITTRGCEFLESIKKGSISSATLSTTANGYQLFCSIPRDCNSLRIMRLIQAANDSSPSNCWADSISSLNSGSSLNWKGGLPLRSFLCVDTLATPIVMYICVMTHYYHATQKTMPRSGGTLARHLTTTDRLSIEEAMQENTTPAQGRHSLNLKTGNEQQSFIWIIAAVRRDCPTIKANIHHIAASTEREARLSLVKEHVCFFAGRINQGVAHA